MKKLLENLVVSYIVRPSKKITTNKKKLGFFDTEKVISGSKKVETFRDEFSDYLQTVDVSFLIKLQFNTVENGL